MTGRKEAKDVPDDLGCRKDQHSIYNMTNEAPSRHFVDTNESLKYEEWFSNQRIEKHGREKPIRVVNSADLHFDNASISLNYDKSLEKISTNKKGN